jgi:hypothetical protein
MRHLDTGLPATIERHFAELADETGEEWPTPISNESHMVYRGRTIEIWFEETGSVYAWKAFCRGFGTFSGIDNGQAIASAMRAIDAEMV